MKKSVSYRHLIVVASLAFLSACSGEDRSGEQPFAPRVQIVGTEVEEQSCTMRGIVKESINSALTATGFEYGKLGEKATKLVSPDTTFVFSARVDSLDTGNYYAVAYATNGVGTSQSDTLLFSVK